MVLDFRVLNPAALAIPAFFLFAGLEYIATRPKQRASFFKFGRPELLDQSIRPELEKTYLPNRSRGLKTQRRHQIYLGIQIGLTALIVFLIMLFFSAVEDFRTYSGQRAGNCHAHQLRRVA